MAGLAGLPPGEYRTAKLAGRRRVPLILQPAKEERFHYDTLVGFAPIAAGMSRPNLHPLKMLKDTHPHRP